MTLLLLERYDYYAILNDDADFIVGWVYPLNGQQGPYKVTSSIGPSGCLRKAVEISGQKIRYSLGILARWRRVAEDCGGGHGAQGRDVDGTRKRKGRGVTRRLTNVFFIRLFGNEPDALLWLDQVAALYGFRRRVFWSQAFARARAGRTLTGSRIACRAGSGEEAQEISAACA